MGKLLIINSFKPLTLLCCIAALGFILPKTSWAQNNPDSIAVPITLYDFHSNGSNPEFEPESMSTISTFKNLTADTLSSDLKPVKGLNTYFSSYIAKWFKKWSAGDFSKPTYKRSGALIRTSTVNHDTTFKNMAFDSFLKFRHIGKGIYQFDNQTFFPLDNNGFGSDNPKNRSHNFDFTMEMHCSFIYKPGMVFSVAGNDDIWVYLNGHKLIDLGGIHAADSNTVFLDTMSKLVLGTTYRLDFFFAQRHAGASTLKITTNIVNKTALIFIYKKPGPPVLPDNKPLAARGSASAGYTYWLYAHVFDSLNTWKPALDNSIKWTILDTMGNPGLTIATGCSTSYAPTHAFGIATITATLFDTTGKSPLLATTIDLSVVSGNAHHVCIEPDSFCQGTRSNNPIPTILLNDNIPSKTIYAVVRDPLGNFVRYASSVAWQDSNPMALSLFPLTGKIWQASVVKANPGQTLVTASEQSLLPGTTRITVEGNVPPVPANAIEVTATLLDTNKDGHLDRISLSWPDSIKIRPDLPTLDQFIAKTGIISPQKELIKLNPSFLIKGKNNTIELILSENKGALFETTWDSIRTLKELMVKYTPMTSDNRPFVIAHVIDSADPVIAHCCIAPFSSQDSLTIEFSEPINWSTTTIDPLTSIEIIKDGQSVVLGAVGPSKILKLPLGVCAFWVPHGTINPTADVVRLKNSKAASNVGYCASVALLREVMACANPFIPGVSAIPPTQSPGTSDPHFGTRIEARLITLSKADTGTIILFDAVGNAVTNKMVMKPDFSRKSLYWIWDGKNRWGAVVGRGTYLARINIKEGIAGSTMVRSEWARTLIGVKK